MTKLKKIAILFEDGSNLKIVSDNTATKKLVESLNIKNTNVKDVESIVLEGICIDFKNGWSSNDRFYNKKSYLEEFHRIAKLAEEGRLFASADHPNEEDDFISKTKEIAGIINKLWYDEENDCCKIRVTIIPTIIGGGYDLIIALKNGATLCVSSRAIGYLNEDTKEAYLDTLYTYDMVSAGGMEVSTMHVVDFNTGINLTESATIVKKEDILTEEAVSEAQQKLFGQVLAVRNGDINRSDVNDTVLNIVDSNMSLEDIKDFAETTHENLPEKLNEVSIPSSIDVFKTTLDDMGIKYDIEEIDNGIIIVPVGNINDIYSKIKKIYKNTSIVGDKIKTIFDKKLSLYESVLSYAKENKINNEKLIEMKNIQDYLGNEVITIDGVESTLIEKPYKNVGAWFSKIEQDGKQIEVMYNDNTDSWSIAMEDDEDPLVEMFESLKVKSLKNKNLVALKECRTSQKKYTKRLLEAEAIEDMSKREKALKLVEEETLDDIEKIGEIVGEEQKLTESFNDTALNVPQPKDDSKKFKNFGLLVGELLKNYKNGKDFTIAADNSLWIQKEIINKGIEDMIKLTEVDESEEKEVPLVESKKIKSVKRLTESLSINRKKAIKLFESGEIGNIEDVYEDIVITDEATLTETDEENQIELSGLTTDEETKQYNVLAEAEIDEFGDKAIMVENEETGDIYVVETEDVETEIPLTESDKYDDVVAEIRKLSTSREQFEKDGNTKRAQEVEQDIKNLKDKLEKLTESEKLTEYADAHQRKIHSEGRRLKVGEVGTVLGEPFIIAEITKDHWIIDKNGEKAHPIHFKRDKKLTESKSGVADRLKVIKDKGIKIGSKGKILGDAFTVADITKDGWIVSKEDNEEAHPSNLKLTESSKYDEIYGVPDRMKIIKDKGIKVGSKGKILDNIFTVDYITKNGYLVGKEDGKEAHPSNLKLTESKKSVKKIAKLTESFSKSIKGLVKFLESDGIDGLPEEVKTDEISAEETKEVTDFVEQDEAETKYVDLPSDEELGENVGLIKNEETGETYIVETEETEIPLTEAKSAKVLAKDYDFTTDIEFFDYIEDSLINGQRKQMMELFMMMDTTSRKNFYNYAKENKFKSLEEISKSKLTESDDIGKKVKFVKDFKEFDNGQTIKAGSTGTIEEFDNDIYMLNVDGKEVWIGKDDKSIKLTESSNKKIKSIRKLVESVSKNKAKKNKAIKLFESDDVNDVAKIDGVVEPIEVTDETQLVEIDGTNIELSGVDGCENGACTVLAESDDNCMMVENNETGEVYIVETEEETPIEEPKTVDEEVAVLKAKNEFLEQELSRVSNFCETASKHILRLEENASLSNRHIRRLEESQDNSLRTKTLNILLENKGLTVLKEQSEEILGKYPQLEMLKENSDSLIKFDQLGDMEKKEILEAIDMVDETELTDIINEYSSKL